MTHASAVLTQELPKAVKNRDHSNSVTKSSPSSTQPLHYTVSPEARVHLDQLREHREKAKGVRIGTY
jgi:hypothetical protein